MSDGHHQRRSNGETIRTTSPDLKQFLEQIKGKRIETKPFLALLQSPCFLPFQKVVAFFGPGGLLHSHLMDLWVWSGLFQSCIWKLRVALNV